MAAADPPLASLVARARDREAPLADRHEAFGAIVRRFQDFAFACACARLRDRSLAEDAAQDAFLVAWTRLAQLRDADALPGWIRRLVLTQCHRRLRAPHIHAVPDTEARTVAFEPPVAADAPDASARVRLGEAIARLTPGDRLVLLLFYGCERSHKEIGAWLGVPATTVGRRISHARRRLRAHAAAVSTQQLRAQPRPGDRFHIDVADRIRRLDLAEVPEAVAAYLVLEPGSDRPLAFAAARPTAFAPIVDLQLAFDARAIRHGAADALLMQIVDVLIARRAVSLQFHCSSTHQVVPPFLRARGFHVLQRFEDWRLETRHAVSRAQAERPRADLDFRDLSALQEPDVFAQALELVTGAVDRRSDAGVVLPIHPDTLRRAIRSQGDGVVAMDGGMLAGFLGARVDDVVPGSWRIDLVAVSRHRRRQGVATALLQQMLSRRPSPCIRCVAIAEAGLAGWLTRLGFTHVRDELILERLLRDTVRVPAALLDQYVGEYVVTESARPMPAIRIERHGDGLVSKARDMRDVLLAASDSEFFTRHHDGQGRFERDAAGAVARLVFTDSGHEFVAYRIPQATRS
jgi:RNA polymerase sigma-70 factor (ECF subfamily)